MSKSIFKNIVKYFKEAPRTNSFGAGGPCKLSHGEVMSNIDYAKDNKTSKASKDKNRTKFITGIIILVVSCWSLVVSNSCWSIVDSANSKQNSNGRGMVTGSESAVNFVAADSRFQTELKTTNSQLTTSTALITNSCSSVNGTSSPLTGPILATDFTGRK